MKESLSLTIHGLYQSLPL